MSARPHAKVTAAVKHYLALTGSRWGRLKQTANKFGVSKHSIAGRIRRMGISK